VPKFKAGQVLLKLRDGKQADALVQSTGPTPSVDALPRLNDVLTRFGAVRVHRVFAGSSGSLSRIVRVEATGNVLQLVAALRALPEVEYAEPNLIVMTQAVPNDTYYASSGAWGQTYRDQWGLQSIHAEPAWDHTKGAGVIVGVVDSGLDYNHPDIAANVWQNPGEIGLDSAGRDKRSNGIDDDGNGQVDDVYGYDFINNDGDPLDDNGHGTHVSGIIGAVSDNGIGIAGVAPAAKIMAVKVFDSGGAGDTEALAAGLYYAAQNGAQVINHSGASEGATQTLLDTITYLHDVKKVLIVAAAGNSSRDVGFTGDETGVQPIFPAASRDVLAVSSFTHLDGLSSFSDFGVKIDVGAPGGGDTDPTGMLVAPNRSILSLLAAGTRKSTPQQFVGGQYLRDSGTSMAAPFVTGVAALVLSQTPTLTPEQLRQVIRAGSRDLGAAGFDTSSGYGMVDAAGALEQPIPLAVHLESPGNTISGVVTVPVTGSVLGPALSKWRLEWGAGNAPTIFTAIASSIRPMDQALLAGWDLSDVPEGVNLLHLVGQNSAGKVYEDRMLVQVDNMVITSPLPAPRVTFGADPVTITGTVSPAHLSNYRVEITGARSGPLNKPAIKLTNGGNVPIHDGTIATWDPTGVPEDQYEITVLANLADGGTATEKTNVIVDRALHLAPIDIQSGIDGNIPQNLISAVDLNGDGAAEMLVGYGHTVRVLEHDGSALPGWPQTVAGSDPTAFTRFGAAAADIDGDKKLDVVAANNLGELFAWSADGSLLAGFPAKVVEPNSPITLADIDGDGVADIVAAAPGGGAMVVHGDGSPLQGFPVAFGDASTRFYQPTVGDLDGDGRPEIVLESALLVPVPMQDGLDLQLSMNVINANGTVRAGWPKDFGGGSVTIDSVSLPVLADLDGDGKLDIVVGSNIDARGQVNAFRADGSELAGWPYVADIGFNTPAIGDLDGDGKPDVFIGGQPTFDTTTNLGVDFAYAFKGGDGSLLPGWPASRNDGNNPWPNLGFDGAALVDIDGDGAPEAILTSGLQEIDAPFALHALRADGSELPGWPRPTPGVAATWSSAPTVADLDGDGLLEVAYIDADVRDTSVPPNFRIRIYDLPTPKEANAPWPMFQHDAAHTGAFLSVRSTPNACKQGGDKSAARCGTQTVYKNKVYECISQAPGVNGEGKGCGSLGVYCSAITPDYPGWGPVAWKYLNDCR